MAKLSVKRQAFVDHYLICRNATESAIKAGYSKHTAKSQGHRLLTYADIMAQIKRQSKSLGIDAEYVLKGYKNIADYDVGDAIDKDGNLKSIKDMPENLRKSITSIDVVETFDGWGKNKTHTGNVRKVRLAPKTEALRALGQYLKLFTEKIELSGKVEVADRIRKARARVGKG